jgi:hypothetical protein
VLSILVLEDLAMAVYLPIVGVLLAGTGARDGAGLDRRRARGGR